MGYSHYWYRPRYMDSAKFKAFSADVEKILHYCQNDLGIELTNGTKAHGVPLADREIIEFNGSDHQPIGKWTTDDEVSIPWPAPSASIEDDAADPCAPKVVGTWFAGTLLSQRTAPVVNGFWRGSYESFFLDRETDDDFSQEDKAGRLFQCIKTAYRPYDIAVTAVLVALKHHFGDDVVISSDGEMKDWRDGQFLCINLLGYGEDFTI